MRFHPKYFIGSFGALILALPVFAAGSTMHTDTTQFDVSHEMTIGSTQLSPGHYTLKGRESEGQIEVLQEGKVVATVPCQWVRLNDKPDHSEILSNNNQVTGVRFAGRTESVQIGS
jgi:hypothetical protein